MLSLDIARILDVTPWQLGESVTSHERAILLHTETILLGVASIKDIVSTEQEEVQEDGVRKRMSNGSASRKLIVHQVDG